MYITKHLSLLFLLTGKCSTSSSLCPNNGGTSACELQSGCNESLDEYSQTDPKLIKIINECYLKPPSGLPYNFTQKDPFTRGQMDQPVLIDHIYNKTSFDGFFIEAGAWDGEGLSNSLLFELKRGWTGLLVEPDKAGYRDLLGKNETCLNMFYHK